MELLKRKSYHAPGKVYFFTATIHKWLPLLASDENKSLITEYLKKLSNEGFITVYAFVIMPPPLRVFFTRNSNKVNRTNGS